MPLETTTYLLLGLTAVVVIMGLLIGSMVLRHRSLEKDLELIQRLAEED